jgi:hypothetical protein
VATQSEPIVTKVERYYSARFDEHGATASGVDWNSEESQTLRFEQLLHVIDPDATSFSLNDFGAGYGALVPHIRKCGLDVDYRGFDVSEPMLEYARREYGGPRVLFVGRIDELGLADYTVASGIFNVKLDVAEEDWRKYVLETLESIAGLSTCGFSFNMLTSYSDPDRMRPDLFYGDPTFYFDHVKRSFTRNVALLHDYGLYEFTVIARLNE